MSANAFPPAEIARPGQPETAVDGAAPAARALLLFGVKHGDNEQVRALARALGLDQAHVHLSFNRWHLLPNWLLPSMPFNLRRTARERLDLAAPAEVIITTGKRPYRAARYLKRKFGDDTVWIHIGRPWGAFAPIDLLVALPQYRLPPAPNLLEIPYPLTRAARPRTDRPGSCIAVLIGGASTSHVVDRGTLKEALLTANALAGAYDVPVRVMTSRRTPTALERLVLDLPASFASVVRWQRRRSPEVTPYDAALGDAAAIVVTGDSASMIADAVETGKPVHIVPARLRVTARLVATISAGVRRASRWLGCAAAADRLMAWLVRHGICSPVRDMDRLIDAALGHVDYRTRLAGSALGIVSCRKGRACSPVALVVPRARALISERTATRRADEGWRPGSERSAGQLGASSAQPEQGLLHEW